MNVHVSYKVNKTPDIEKEINHLIEKLRKRLQVFRPELIHLKGIVEQNSPREGFVVSFNLRLPSGQMAVQESADTASAGDEVSLLVVRQAEPSARAPLVTIADGSLKAHEAAVGPVVRHAGTPGAESISGIFPGGDCPNVHGARDCRSH